MRRRRAPYSVYLGARLLHDARPPLPFPGRPRAEFLRWAALGHQAEGLHLALSLRALDQLVQLRIEPRDDFPGYSSGSGYPAVTSTSGTGIVAPAGIPREIVARLNSKLNELIERPETQSKMKAFGLVPQSGPPEEFGAWAARERQRWTRVVKQSGAKAD